MESLLKDQTEQEKFIDQMRLMSIAEGKLYDLQILNLKHIPLVVFGEELKNEFKLDFEKRTIHFTLTGKSDYPKGEKKVRLEHLVKYVQRLIGNFAVTVDLIETKNGRQTNATRKGRKKPNGNGKRRLRKVRNR